MDREQMQEIIDNMRNIVKPYIAKQLRQINFEGCGHIDKAEFETEFEVILTLAEQALALSPKSNMDKEQIIDGLEKLRFFNQRAGRELWFYKSKEIQDIDIADTSNILAEAIKAIPPAEPYEGMTNGEVIKAVFPNAKITETSEIFPNYPYVDVFFIDEYDMNCFPRDWWNSPYSERSEDD